MKTDFHERYSEAPPAPPTARATGFVFTVVATLVAAFFYTNITIAIPALAIAFAFALTSWLRPSLLNLLNRVWFRLSLLLNRVVNPIVMLLIYLLAIVPSGLIMQLLRDPLRAKRLAERKSHWIDRDTKAEAGSMKHQF